MPAVQPAVCPFGSFSRCAPAGRSPGRRRAPRAGHAGPPRLARSSRLCRRDPRVRTCCRGRREVLRCARATGASAITPCAAAKGSARADPAAVASFCSTPGRTGLGSYTRSGYRRSSRSRLHRTDRASRSNTTPFGLVQRAQRGVAEPGKVRERVDAAVVRKDVAPALALRTAELSFRACMHVRSLEDDVRHGRLEACGIRQTKNLVARVFSRSG